MNRAVELVRPHTWTPRVAWIPLEEGEPWWWCFGDHQTHDMFRIAGGVHRPRLFAPRGVMEAWERRSPASWEAWGRGVYERGEYDAWDDRVGERETPIFHGWRKKSGTAAIVLGVRRALARGLTRVDVLGADMVGKNDWTGDRADGRSRERWQSERQQYNRVRYWAEKQGVRLVRWLPEGRGELYPSDTAVVDVLPEE